MLICLNCNKVSLCNASYWLIFQSGGKMILLKTRSAILRAQNAYEGYSVRFCGLAKVIFGHWQDWSV